jgi:hypothetical protein
MNRENRAYMVAGALSVVLFLLGVSVGSLIQKNSTQYTLEQVDGLRRRVENAQLEYVYLTTMGERLGCESLSALIDEGTSDVWAIGRQLQGLDEEGAAGNQFHDLKRDYSLLSVRAWLLNTYMAEKCHTTSPIIMFLYSIPCDDCVRQGKILDDIRGSDYPGMKVFVLDANYNMSIIRTVTSAHNITDTPAVIVGNDSHTGYMSRERLLELIAQTNT